MRCVGLAGCGKCIEWLRAIHRQQRGLVSHLLVVIVGGGAVLRVEVLGRLHVVVRQFVLLLLPGILHRVRGVHAIQCGGFRCPFFGYRRIGTIVRVGPGVHRFQRVDRLDRRIGRVFVAILILLPGMLTQSIGVGVRLLGRLFALLGLQVARRVLLGLRLIQRRHVQSLRIAQACFGLGKFIDGHRIARRKGRGLCLGVRGVLGLVSGAVRRRILLRPITCMRIDSGRRGGLQIGRVPGIGGKHRFVGNRVLGGGQFGIGIAVGLLGVLQRGIGRHRHRVDRFTQLLFELGGVADRFARRGVVQRQRAAVVGFGGGQFVDCSWRVVLRLGVQRRVASGLCRHIAGGRQGIRIDVARQVFHTRQFDAGGVLRGIHLFQFVQEHLWRPLRFRQLVHQPTQALGERRERRNQRRIGAQRGHRGGDRRRGGSQRFHALLQTAWPTHRAGASHSFRPAW